MAKKSLTEIYRSANRLVNAKHSVMLQQDSRHGSRPGYSPASQQKGAGPYRDPSRKK